MATFHSGTLRNRYIRALSGDEARGRRAEDEFIERSTTFDPYESAQTAARAQVAAVREQFGEDLDDLRDFNAGIGRLETGYGGMDEDELFEDVVDRTSRQIASNSLAATSLDLQNTQGIGAYGERTTNRYLDLLSGGLDREQAERNARRAERASLWGTVGGLAGGVAGSFLGPIGGAAGAAVGRRLFGGS